MVNKVELSGFAGINPEVITLKEGRKRVQFSLATTESYKNQSGEWVKDTTWHKIVMWNKLADQAVTLIKKGTRVSLFGKLVNHNYTDDKGNKRLSVEIFANSFEVIKNEKTEGIPAA